MESRTRSAAPPTGVTRPTTRRREVEHQGLVWLDVPQPNNADVAFLRERLRLDPLALDDVLSTIQRPKLEIYDSDGYLFLIVQVPILDRDNRVVVSEVNLFVGRDFVVTIHDTNLKPLRRLLGAASGDEAARVQLMGRGPGYLLYRILDTIAKQTFPLVYRFDEEIARIDGGMFGQDVRALIQDCAVVQRDTLALQAILAPNLPVAERLRSIRMDSLRIDPERFFADYADSIGKLNDIVAEQRSSVEAICGTVSALAGLEQGRSLRILVVVGLILVPLVLLAALAALSIVAPPLGQPIVFAAALLLTLAAIGGSLAYARSRRWW